MANEDPKYTAWIRSAPCSTCNAPPPSCAHHHTHAPSTLDGERARGKGQKAHDRYTIPLCHRCHMDFHGASGRFKVWNKSQRNDWQDALVRRFRAAYSDRTAF